MMKSIFVYLFIFLCMIVTTGCIDRRELNDLAFVLGWGYDKKQDGTFLASAQIAIPSKLANASGGGGGGGGEDGYLLETATGKNALDTAQNMQTKLSRVIFASHRRVLVLGENLARNGISDIIDEFSRNPDVRLRTDIFVVKDGQAKDFLSIPYKLEKIPALGPIKIHESMGGTESVTFMQFLSDASSEGINATLPTIKVVNSGNSAKGQSSKTFKITGRALLDNDLKMVGHLTLSEAETRLLIRNELKRRVYAAYVPEGKGNVGFDGRKYKSKIKPVVKNGKIIFLVSLEAKGMIRENNTNLDLKNAKNITLVERALNKKLVKEASDTISHVQKDFGLDVFGFGEALHRKYPKEWKSWKRNWGEKFAGAEVRVTANVSVEDVGSSGPSLHLKESGIKK